MVQSVIFYTEIQDQLSFSCRFMRKAKTNGISVLTLCESSEKAAELSQQLWQITPADFVPHCTDESEAFIKQNSSIFITSQGKSEAWRTSATKFDILLNLTNDIIDSEFDVKKIAELVGVNEQDKQLARQKWSSYKRKNLNLTSVKP